MDSIGLFFPIMIKNPENFDVDDFGHLVRANLPWVTKVKRTEETYAGLPVYSIELQVVRNGRLSEPVEAFRSPNWGAVKSGADMFTGDWMIPKEWEVFVVESALTPPNVHQLEKRGRKRQAQSAPVFRKP